jgi:hypothetical protein
MAVATSGLPRCPMPPKSGFVSHGRASGPARLSPAGQIGFVFPGRVSMPIIHKPLSAKHLRPIPPAAKLALFRKIHHEANILYSHRFTMTVLPPSSHEGTETRRTSTNNEQPRTSNPLHPPMNPARPAAGTKMDSHKGTKPQREDDLHSPPFVILVASCENDPVCARDLCHTLELSGNPFQLLRVRKADLAGRARHTDSLRHQSQFANPSATRNVTRGPEYVPDP